MKKKLTSRGVMESLIILTCIMYILFSLYRLSPYKIYLLEGDSMLPTINRQLGIFKETKLDSRIERGEIVSVNFFDKELNQTIPAVKRVIAVPNDIVKINPETDILEVNYTPEEKLKLLLNYETTGKNYNEDLNRHNFMNKNSWGEVILGSNEYFLLGDNRKDSKDSRYSGPFHKVDIKEKLVYLIDNKLVDYVIKKIPPKEIIGN